MRKTLGRVLRIWANPEELTTLPFLIVRVPRPGHSNPNLAGPENEHAPK